MSKVKRESFLHTLEMISPGLSSRGVLEQAESFVFEKNKAYTYNDEIAASCDSPISITGAIPAEPLKNILHKIKQEYLDVSQTNGKVTFKGKGETFDVIINSKIELSIDNLEIPSKWKKLPDGFCNAIKSVSPCAGKDEAQFALTCIHIYPSWIEAFDTNQFARMNIQSGLKKETWVRQVSIKHIVDLDMTEFAETDQWLHFRNPNGLTLSCRRYSDKYPTAMLTKLTKLTGQKIQLPKGLVDLSERADVFSSQSQNPENNIIIDLKPGWVKVKGEGIYGKYYGRRKIKYKGEELTFLVHPALLAQITKQHQEVSICTGKIKALKAELGDFTYLTSLGDPKEPKTETEPKVKKKKNAN